MKSEFVNLERNSNDFFIRSVSNSILSSEKKTVMVIPIMDSHVDELIMFCIENGFNYSFQAGIFAIKK